MRSPKVMRAGTGNKKFILHGLTMIKRLIPLIWYRAQSNNHLYTDKNVAFFSKRRIRGIYCNVQELIQVKSDRFTASYLIFFLLQNFVKEEPTNVLQMHYSFSLTYSHMH